MASLSGVVLAHAACAGLVALDLAARTVRLRLLAAGAGCRLGGWDAFRCNVLADAGAALSPMRLAGEPARIAGLTAAGVPMPATLAMIGWEMMVAWPTLLAVAGVAVAVLAPQWWAGAAPVLGDRLDQAVPALAAVGVLMVVAVVAAHQVRRRMPATFAARLGDFRIAWRGMPRATLQWCILLSLVNIVARVALLPVLALTLVDPPPTMTVWFGSFLLVHGQLIVPTPAGLGVVELGFLGGAAGALGGGVELLLAWRWWATGATTLLGLGAAWHWRAWFGPPWRAARTKS